MTSIIDDILQWWYTYVVPAGYTTVEMLLFFTGFASWVIAYYFILKQIRQYKFVEMPLLIGPANYAWEFVWSFLYKGDLGEPFQWGCRAWFFMDTFINFYIIKYGKSQIETAVAKRNFYLLYAFSLISWFFIVWTMGETGDDNQLGVVSALLINVAMSILYIMQLVAHPDRRGKGISMRVAIFKMIGTGVISVASSWHWNDGFLNTLGVLSFILDVAYLYMFVNYKPEQAHVSTAK